jgi:hypothetical protein
MRKLTCLIIVVLLTTMSFNKVYSCPGATGSVEKIVCLADSLKSTLTTTQLASLQLPYSYTNSQTWSNLPVTMQARIGIKIGTLSAAQLAIVKLIVKEISGTTVNEGYDEAEQLLLADAYLSANGGGTAYGSGQYYLCFNGTPSLTGLFSVKFGGHHLQIENTYNNGVMVGGTPHFEAIEPLTFTSGGNTYSTITQEKNALAAIFSTLSTTELATAHLSSTFTDILMGAKNNGAYKDWIFPATKVGLRVGTLSSSQKSLVLDAIKTYVLDIDDSNATAIINQYSQELNDTYIAYSGNSTLNTQNDYVRIDGPGVWIEFTVQGGIIMSGVHYHSIWRDHTRDYGGAGSTAGVQTTAVGVATATGINQIKNIRFLSCYPNPSNGNFNLQFSLNKSTSIKLFLIDLLGRVITVKEYTEMPSGDQAILLNLSDIDNGIYHLVLEADKVKYTTKIIKE